MIQIIEILKWPAVAIIAVLIFRTALTSLINRITKATKEGIEAAQQPTEKETVRLHSAEITLGTSRPETGF